MPQSARRDVASDVSRSGVVGAAPAWALLGGSRGLGLNDAMIAELEVLMAGFLDAHDLARMSATSRGFRALADAVCCARLSDVMGARCDVRSLPLVSHFQMRYTSGLPRLLDVLLSTRQESYGSTLSCGEAHTAVVHDSGASVIAFGEGEQGQLGGGRSANCAVPSDMQTEPTPEGAAPPRFVAVACGAAHTAALTADGRIFSCGSNIAGQLGPGAPAEGSARLAPLRDAPELPAQQQQPPASKKLRRAAYKLSEMRFVQVVAGRYFTAAITTEGRVAVIGSGMDVKLERAILLPRGDMNPDERVVMLAAGAQHLLMLTNANRLFAVGDGSAGKLGLARNLVADARETAVERTARLNRSARRPGLVALPHDADMTIVHVAAGGNHSGFISGDGALFMWGCGRNGELGLGTFARAVHAPTRVKLPGASPFALNMSCGKAHTAVLTTCGRIVTFGCNAYRQDGKQTRFWATNAPQAICDGDLAKHKPTLALVVCGGRHTAVVDATGALFTFGDPLCCGRPLRLAAMQGNNHVPRRVELGGARSYAVNMTPRFGSI